MLPEEQVDALDDAAAKTIAMVKRAKKHIAETEKDYNRCSTGVCDDVSRGLPVFESDAAAACPPPPPRLSLSWLAQLFGNDPWPMSFP